MSAGDKFLTDHIVVGDAYQPNTARNGVATQTAPPPPPVEIKRIVAIESDNNMSIDELLRRIDDTCALLESGRTNQAAAIEFLRETVARVRRDGLSLRLVTE